MPPHTHTDEPYVRPLLLQETRLVATLKSVLTSLSEVIESTDGDIKIRLATVQRTAQAALNDDDLWSTFNHRYNVFHGNYLAKLARDYPTITAAELRLCAFLRLPMQSKDIALLSNCSVRSIEKHRERIRRKLGIEHGVNLITFLAARYADDVDA